MRNQILVVTLMILLVGCQSTSVEQDPLGKRLPLGTISTMNATFDPAILPYLNTVSIWRFSSMPNTLGVGAAGAYIPFTKIILLSDTASRPNDTLVHEMLHVVCFKEKFLCPHLFEESLERFLNDPDYQGFVAGLNGALKSYKESGRFPRSFIPDEYYAHIGEYLYSRRKGGEVGLPEYMARHYRGVLNPLLFFDRRYYQSKIAPDFDKVIALLRHEGQQYRVIARMDHLQALVRHGGVLKAKEAVTGTRQIRSVGLADTPEEGEVVLPALLKPHKVFLTIEIPPGTAVYPFGSNDLFRLVLYSEDTEEFTLGVRTARQLAVPKLNIELSWQQSQQVLGRYLSRRMQIRLKR